MEIQTVTHTEHILRMATEIDGASCAKMAQRHGTKQNTFSKIIAHQIKKGRLFKSNRRSARVRWFDTQARADDWAAMEPCEPSEWSEAGFKAWDAHPERVRREKKAPKPAPKLVEPVKKPGNLHSLSKKPGPPALTRFTAGASKLVSFAPDAPVKADGAIYTICPSGQDFRFTAIPEETPAIFAAKGGGLGVGRYLQEVAA
jgi:hypothetical protein